ncbi:MAG: methyltransferase domain-containing protein [Alphaproteobacteria bacterium]|jgi:SAM-dependent methyltransferase|nr:methyltransferase domain-containing protein [Alphaproteobacteria bacterium]
MSDYVHGYSAREAERLGDQADILRPLIHEGTAYAAGARVLEIGCGTGEQTVTLAARSLEAAFVSVELSAPSLAAAQARACRAGLANVAFVRGDLFALPFADRAFDHAFICFVLEHLAEPERALALVRRLVRPGGTVTVMEGDHGSCYFHPETEAGREAWESLIAVQRHAGGDARIGRRLYPLLAGAGFADVRVAPKMVYADEAHPAEMDLFVARTIVPMVEGVRDKALALGLIDEAIFARGIADLRATGTPPAGTFCYTFFKARARVP